ncbi:MAG TPA: Ig-like domain-containing protein, partial [Isosphaeraceae bacterium]|nr:Ig-like domain-containing protein [Isosphaeraceae bacterium]
THALTWLILAAAPGPIEDRISLQVEPAQVRLSGSDASAQILTSAQVEDGRTIDVSRLVRYRSLDPAIADVGPDGLVQPRGDGRTEIVVRHQDQERRIPVEVLDFANSRPVGFRSQVVPIFSKYGCNAGGCHGKATGQNGVKLSLLGFDPRFDYEALVFEARGRRVFPSDPARSLLLRKPTAAIPHGGGRKFEPGSPEYRTIERWVRTGMPFEVENEPVLQSLSVSPAQRVVGPESEQQLRAVAHYSDGSEVDVTRLAQYQSNAADLATADEQGKVTTLDGVGEAAVMVRFGGQVSVARVTIPRSGEAVAWTEPPSNNLIDPLIFRKLRQLNIPPSDPCTDAEFARRASLDICG